MLAHVLRATLRLRVGFPNVESPSQLRRNGFGADEGAVQRGGRKLVRCEVRMEEWAGGVGVDVVQRRPM